jgi:hypothetical protein
MKKTTYKNVIFVYKNIRINIKTYICKNYFYKFQIRQSNYKINKNNNKGKSKQA